MKKRTSLDINLAANKDTRVALSVLTAADRLHDKYTCNVCSALLNIRPVNVADMGYHYFLFSSPPHSLSASLQHPPPAPPARRLSPTPLSLHNLPSAHQFSRGRAGRGANSRQMCGALTAAGLNAAFTPPNELVCLLPKAVLVR